MFDSQLCDKDVLVILCDKTWIEKGFSAWQDFCHWYGKTFVKDCERVLQETFLIQI